MKKSVMKIVSLCLCGTLAAGCAGVRAMASGNEEAESVKPVRLSSTASTQASQPSARDETVYILANADGSVEKIIVSDWLKNANGSNTLEDNAKLDGVENVKGNESFTLNGDTRVWDALGNDIYTQGTTDQDLPVDMSVSYTLDGKVVTPDGLAGKSGKVTIRFDYTNHEYQMMDVGGEQEKIYVPFAMLTGVVLDNEIFRNVEVSSGKVYNDGGRTAVIGMAFPGLQENLDIDSEKLEIPDYVEITADVTGFKLGTTFTVAVSDLFGQLDTDKLDETDDLNESLDKLTDAMAQLMDGSDQLYDGLDTLLEKSGQLADGVDKLAAGAGTLKEGADALGTGAAQLQTGADALCGGLDTLNTGLDMLGTGLSTLNGNSAALNAGAKQVFDTLLASASQQLTAAGAQLPAELTAENYGKILDGVIAALPEAASAPVVQLKASLDSYNQFYQGLQSYTAGVAQAASGVAELKDGADQLSGGASQLSGGITQLNGGASRLSGGAAELYGGVMTLKDSTPALVDGDLEGLVGRLQATADASRGYQSFSGVSGETEGQVKFIYRTAPVEIAE